VASLQRWRFAVVVLLHGAIASAITLLSTVFPIAFVNGWMLGSFLWACVWFEASPRAVVDRASRLFISGLVIIWMLHNAKQLSYGMFPEVGIFAVLIAPFVMLISRWSMACFQNSLNAPDIVDRHMRPLSILDCVIAMTMVGLLFACLRTHDPIEVSFSLVMIGFAIFPGMILALMIVGLAGTNRWITRVSIVGLAIAFLAIASWGALNWISIELAQRLSWVEFDEKDSVVDSIAEANVQIDLSTIVVFAVSVVAPCILTLALLRYQGYRLMSRSKDRTSRTLARFL